MKKYEITDIAHPDNPNLHRIRAVTDLTEDVLAGMLGGYVESRDNLDQDGRAWISADAIACENAVVCGDAVLTDHAVARGNAYVGKNATVMGDATVQDDAIVCGGLLMGKSCVCGYAVIRQDEQTLCAPIIDGSARVYGEISGNVVCRGNAVVLPGTKLDNRTQDCFVLEDAVERSEYTAIVRDKLLHCPMLVVCSRNQDATTNAQIGLAQKYNRIVTTLDGLKKAVSEGDDLVS